MNICQKFLTDIPLQGDQFPKLAEMNKFKDLLFIETTMEELGAKSPADYDNIKDALRRLAATHFEIEDDEVWTYTSIIEEPVFIKNTKEVHFRISEVFLHCFMNFSIGYSHFILQKSLSFQSQYTSRMYEIICGTSQTTRWDIDTLKEMLGKYKTYSEREANELQARAAARHVPCSIIPGQVVLDHKGDPIEKYKDTNNFIKYTLSVAKKELDESSSWTFEYVPVKEGRSIKYIDITPIAREDEQEQHTAQNIAVKDKSRALLFLPKPLRDCLRKHGWKDREIRNNRSYLSIIAKLQGTNAAVWAEDVYGRIPIVDNIKGYFINTVKNTVQEEAKTNYKLRKYIKEAWPDVYPDIAKYDVP